MSATYNCNFCGKELRRHINSFSEVVWINKFLHRNKNSDSIDVRLKMNLGQEDLDICNNCLNEVKEEAIKEFSKIEIK